MRFFAGEINGDAVTLSKEDSFHAVKSLRFANGDEITVCGKNGFDYYCKIEKITDVVSAKILYKKVSVTEPGVYLKLFQSLPKAGKMEHIIQKSVELGAAEIIPVISSRSISRPDAEKAAKKVLRYRKISKEAAMQSQRGIIPPVRDIISFNEAVEKSRNDEAKILFYEGGGLRLSEIIKGDEKNISIFIGSEGGFSEEEVLYAKNHGFITAGLGKRILRCETAPVTAISLIMYLTKNI